MSTFDLGSSGAGERGASLKVQHSVTVGSADPSNDMLSVQVYRRYHYEISTHEETVARIGPEYRITWTVKRDGAQYQASVLASGTDSTAHSNDANEAITDFRDWLLEQIEGGDLDPSTCEAYIRLWSYVDGGNTPSFPYQVAQLLAACPVTESASDANSLVATAVALLGYEQV